MKPTWIALVLGLSLACLSGSYFLLPKVVSGEETPTSAAVRADTLALPVLSEGVFHQAMKSGNVSPGDTLGFVLKDRYDEARRSLLAFAKTSQRPPNLLLFPKAMRKELSTMLKQRQQSTAPTGASKGGYVLRGKERDYLESEVMGAEDASTELIGKLSQLSAAGEAASSASQNLQRQLRQKQSFIAKAKKQLAQRKQPTTSAVAETPAQRPQLTDAQRERVLTLSAQLEVDSRPVFAPIAGMYSRPDSGIGYIIVRSDGSSEVASGRSNKASGYILKSEGSPVLWGTAQRQDSLGAGAVSGKELKVSVQ